MPRAFRTPAALAFLPWMACLGLRAQSPIGTIIAEQSRTAFSVSGAGSRATGMGGAFIAVADDATAVSFNPAGLAQLLNPEVSFVGRGLMREVSYTDVSTAARNHTNLVTDSLNSESRFDPLLLSGTLPLRIGGHTLALQLSAQRFLALAEDNSRDLVETPTTPGGTSGFLRQSIQQTGQIDLYSFAMAYEASQRILVGVSVNSWRGVWDLNSDSSKTYGGRTAFVDFSQSNHLVGTNFNLGLIWRWPTWSLGLVRRTAFQGTYTFGTTFQASAGGPPISRVSPDLSVGLRWPSTTGIGFAYRPADRWLVTADLVHTAWSDARYTTNQRSLDGLNFFDLDKGFRTPDATDFHMGFEHLTVTRGGHVISLRGGLSREPQPVVDATTGEQRVMYGASVGVGIKVGRYSFDTAYRYAWAKRTASQFLDVDQLLSRTPPTSIGTERVREQRFVFDCIIQFDREPVQKLLHHLFVGD